MSIEVRRSDDRFTTRNAGLVSRHCFSYGSHYDATNTHFGLLLASNHDVLAPGAGFESHRHRDVEIVTWVISGALDHSDSLRRSSVLGPGLVQRLSAGSGVSHSEVNASNDEPVEYVQMWVAPDAVGGSPDYAVADVRDLLVSGQWVVVASGASAPLLIRSSATLSVATAAAGACLPLPAAGKTHLYVATGTATMHSPDGDVHLVAGDAARISKHTDLAISSTGPEFATMLAWQMA